MFNLCDVLQECNLAVKLDLPIVTSPPLPPLAAAATAITADGANNLQHTHKENVILCSKLYFVLLIQGKGFIPI